MFANVVYARLAASCGDREDRERLDRELCAPLRGWDAVNRELWAIIGSAGEG
jgi:hypothetical protein